MTRDEIKEIIIKRGFAGYEEYLLSECERLGEIEKGLRKAIEGEMLSGKRWEEFFKTSQLRIKELEVILAEIKADPSIGRLEVEDNWWEKEINEKEN